jgi:hypothetical protein
MILELVLHELLESISNRLLNGLAVVAAERWKQRRGRLRRTRWLGLTRFRGHPEAFTGGVPDADNPPTLFA